MTIPERFNLMELPNRLPPSLDAFLCSASYEDRCLSIPLRVSFNSVKHAFVCANEDHLDRMQDNFDKLRSHFADKTREVMLRSDDPVTGTDRLNVQLQRCKTQEPQRIVIDATTFTHEGLLILIKILAISLSRSDEVWIAYAPASEYAVGLDNGQKWLSRGVREIRSVLGYPGLLNPSQKMHMIVLVGFEAERAKLLIDTCEPDAISLGKARDATDAIQRHLPINIATLGQLSVHYLRYNEFDFSCVDAIAT